MAVRVVQGASSASTVAVAPVARSVCALLVAIGVPDRDLDAVMAILADEDLFPPDSVPQTMTEIVQQARHAQDILIRRQLRAGGTVDAAQ